MDKLSFDISSSAKRKIRNNSTVTATSVYDLTTNSSGHAVAGFYTEIDKFILFSFYFKTVNKEGKGMHWTV